MIQHRYQVVAGGNKTSFRDFGSARSFANRFPYATIYKAKPGEDDSLNWQPIAKLRNAQDRAFALLGLIMAVLVAVYFLKKNE